MVSKVFEHPFDLCKVRLQTQVLDQMARYSGPIDCLTKTWKNEGLRGLYRVRIYYLRGGCVAQILKDYMRWTLFVVIGFTSTNRGSDGREFVSLSIIQRIPESHPMGEPYTSTPRPEPFPCNLGRRRCWCCHEFCPVSPFLSSLRRTPQGGDLKLTDV
jgi:hypothetical protein